MRAFRGFPYSGRASLLNRAHQQDQRNTPQQGLPPRSAQQKAQDQLDGMIEKKYAWGDQETFDETYDELFGQP